VNKDFNRLLQESERVDFVGLLAEITL